MPSFLPSIHETSLLHPDYVTHESLLQNNALIGCSELQLDNVNVTCPPLLLNVACLKLKWKPLSNRLRWIGAMLLFRWAMSGSGWWPPCPVNNNPPGQSCEPSCSQSFSDGPPGIDGAVSSSVLQSEPTCVDLLSSINSNLCSPFHSCPFSTLSGALLALPLLVEICPVGCSGQLLERWHLGQEPPW